MRGSREFDIYIEIRDRRKFIGIGTPPENLKKSMNLPLGKQYDIGIYSKIPL